MTPGLPKLSIFFGGGELPSISPGLVSPAQFNRESKTHSGGVYDARGLRYECLREGDKLWQPVDPADWPLTAEIFKFRSGIYLGHLMTHFGHFLLETLPQLYWTFIQKSDNHIFHPWLDAEWIENWETVPHIKDTLSALGLSPNSIRLARYPAEFARLHLAPRRTPLEGHSLGPRAAIFDFVADTINGRLGAVEAGVGLYLSRRHLQRETVENEEEIEEIFKAHGFDVVHPQELPFSEQVRMVNGASVVAGLGGSAMHLGVFLRKGSLQINLGGRTGWNPTEKGWEAQRIINQERGVSSIVFRESVAKKNIPVIEKGLKRILKRIESW